MTTKTKPKYTRFILIILILLLIAGIVGLIIFFLTRKHKDGYTTLLGSPPPSDYQPIFAFTNGSNFDIQIAGGEGWKNHDNYVVPMTPPVGTFMAKGAYYAYVLLSWANLDLYSYDTSGNQVHVGQISISLQWPYASWPYLAVSSVTDGCSWKGDPWGLTPGIIFSIDYDGVDPTTNRPIQTLRCSKCDKYYCNGGVPPSPSIFSLKCDNITWYADYNGDQFTCTDNVIVQNATGAGGRLFVGDGNSTLMPFSVTKGCAWKSTGQWQIDIQLNRQDKTGWCETFYLGGRNTKNCAPPGGYLDGQDGITTEIDIVETTWGGCTTHTTNILNFGSTGKIDHTVCTDGPSKPGTWFTAGARITETKVEIYHILPGKALTVVNKLDIPAGKKHTQPMVPYIGSWCINKISADECKVPGGFTTSWKNFLYSDDPEHMTGNIQVLVAK